MFCLKVTISGISIFQLQQEVLLRFENTFRQNLRAITLPEANPQD